MRFLLVKALDDAHVYSRHIAALAGALSELGHAVTVADLSARVAAGQVEIAHLERALAEIPCDAVVSISSFFGAAQVADGRSLYDALGVKFVGWQLDHPIYAPQSLARALRNRHAVYANDNHKRFVRALGLPGRGLTLLPGACPPAGPVKAHADRTHGVLVAATMRGRPEATWEALEDSPGKRLLVGVLERLAASREAALLDAFNETAVALGLGAELGADPTFDEQMIALLREPLTYLRNLDRLVIVLALANSGLPVTLCGAGWRALIGDRPRVTFIEDPIDFADMPALYNDARVVVNLNAGNGACERALDAAAAGAAVVSDDSGALADLFTPGEEIAFYHRARPAEVIEAAGRLLEGGSGEAMAERGHRRVRREGLWRHRAAQLVGFLELA